MKNTTEDFLITVPRSEYALYKSRYDKIKDLQKGPQYHLKEFVLAALTGLCANPNVYASLDFDQIGEGAAYIANATMKALQIIATEGVEEYQEDQSHVDTAKVLWQKGQKLEACKLLHSHGMSLKGAKKYCETNF